MEVGGGGGGDLAMDLLRAMRRRAGQRRFVPDGPLRRGPLRRAYGSEPLVLAELIEVAEATVTLNRPGGTGPAIPSSRRFPAGV